MEIKNILVTGSDGYIGAVLVPKLIKKNFSVTGLDTFYYKYSVPESYYPQASYINKDIRAVTEKDLKNVDAIIHLAALSNDSLGELDQKLTEQINYRATVRLARLAKKVGVKRFIFSSSCSIYGKTENGIVSESSQVNPLTAYAKSKILSERALLKLADENFCVGILRNATVYGYSPKFRDDLVVNNFVSNGLATGQIKILSDGSPWRPLIDARDLSDIFIAFLLSESRKINGQIFNIGFNKNNFQIKDVLRIIHRQMPECEIIATGEHGADTRSYKVNFDKFSQAFPQIKQKWTLRKSVKHMIIQLKKNNFSEEDLKQKKFTRLAVLKNLLQDKLDDSLFWKKNKLIPCRVCDKEIVEVLSLNEMPLVNSFLTKQQLSSEKKYELNVAFCPKCYLVQLTKTISPKELFSHYIYLSSTSKTIDDHSRKTAVYLTKRLNLQKNSLVVEIASNDGVLLQYFKKLGVKILGIDPAKNIAKIANQKGIPTLPKFFNYPLAAKLKKGKKLQADLIFGANVLAHVPQIKDFVKGVKVLLAKKGTAVFEFPYLKGLLENKFDIIYHEHVFYYSLIALKNLFRKASLEIYDVEMTPMQGGSLRIFVSHPGTFKLSASVKNLEKKELQAGFDKLETYQTMERNILKLKTQLLTLLKRILSENKTIAAYSAPAKGMTLLNYFGIDKKYLSFIVDKAKEKQGLYTPGIQMRVYPIEKIFQERPDYVLILCWNIADEVMESLKNYKKKGGKFIIPIPKLKVL